jgi:isopenicillin N synthase-like dioxygenase
MNMDRGLEFVGINYYPPCHQPEHAIGQPNHTDYGLLTLLIDNGLSGLQVKHNGKWLNANRPSNAFLVNLSDSMQVATFLSTLCACMTLQL